jgi:predicted ester cyclase
VTTLRGTASGAASATHRGDGLSVPATGKPVRFRDITWMRFEGGKIAEGWDAWNAGGLVQQLQSGT